MRIAQIAPLFESVPPRLYGGTERVVSYLTEELVHKGHDVTLFASGDSVTDAELDSVVPRALRLDATSADPVAAHRLMFERVLARADEFDVINFHTDFDLHFPVLPRFSGPHVTTVHGRLDVPQLQALYDEVSGAALISVSRAQQQPLSSACWRGSIHHGLPRTLHTLRAGRPGYFAFLGRISREKRVDRAIEIALRLGVPLKIAAKVDRADRAYFEAEIEPLLEHPLIEFVGEIGEHEKGEFLGNARALLFAIDWPEPFGLVMIEAMACGTPVIAFDCGSVREVIRPGVTGYVVHDMPQALAAAARVHELDRRGCRAEFERRFTAERMADDYLQVYAALSARRPNLYRLTGTAAAAAE